MNEDVINTAVKGVIAIKILEVGTGLLDQKRRKPRKQRKLGKGLL